jgi:hypothetical protein
MIQKVEIIFIFRNYGRKYLDECNSSFFFPEITPGNILTRTFYTIRGGKVYVQPLKSA